MARIVGGIGMSHTPTIGFAVDTKKQNDPGWAPIFEGFAAIRQWLKTQKVDVLLFVYNDHVTSFFFDHYSAFALGVDDIYVAADEGGGPRAVPPVRGHDDLARYIGAYLMASEFDMSFFQGKAVDHGCMSPLSMLADEDGPWNGAIVPLQVGVLQFPIPSARRCYKLGQALRKAIESYPDAELRVAIVATGGLSHQVHGERAGFLNEAWDEEFLDLLEADPEVLADMRIAEFAEKGGVEGAEVIMWVLMRGALSGNIRRVHRHTYAPSATNIATAIWEDTAPPTPEDVLEGYRQHAARELQGAEKLSGSYPFTLARSHDNFRVNDFLHRIVEPAHRQRFLNDFDGLCDEYGLSDSERELIRSQDWLAMIQAGVSFFVIEKMAALVGVSNPEVYAQFRGETLDEYLATRKVAMKYSVGASLPEPAS